LQQSSPSYRAGLFHKAIMQSGVSLSPWAVGQHSDRKPPLQHATDLAQRAGCTTTLTHLDLRSQTRPLLLRLGEGLPVLRGVNTTDMVACLRNVAVDKLLKAAADMFVSWTGF
jgi:hypothetical protein